MKTTTYHHGDIVMVREVWAGRIWSARPMRVVTDTSDMLALYIAPGTSWKQPTNLKGERPAGIDRKEEKWLLRDAVWTGLGALRLTTPGSLFSVHIHWDNHYRDIRHWYVNLEDPLYRTRFGFEYMDMELDVVLSGDMSEWHWKDEDGLQALESLGLVSQEKSLKLRSEGESAVKMLQSSKSPFNVWRAWLPPPNWQGIPLPPGWDRT